jgi:pimeloyl-ACP methyl ester carboxylesterase
MNYVYIHGANATAQSFNYLREHIRGKDMVLEYNCAYGFEDNLKKMQETIKDVKDIFFICHSMGGIYALHLSNLLPDNVKGAVTLATPYGGSAVAEIAKWVLPYYRLIHDIVPNSKTIKECRAIKIQHPWLQVVTISGNVPWLVQPNDGIISIASMRCREDIEQIDVDLNHYEVVVSPQTVKIIKNKIKEVDKRFKIFGN